MTLPIDRVRDALVLAQTEAAGHLQNAPRSSSWGSNISFPFSSPMAYQRPIFEDRSIHILSNQTVQVEKPDEEETQQAEKRKAFYLGALVTVIGCAILGYGQKIYQQRKEALEKRKTNAQVLNFFELHNLLPELTTLQKQDCKEVLHKLSSLHQQTIAKTHQYAVALIVGLCGGISLVAGGLGAGAGFIAFGYGLLVLSAAVAAFTLGAHWNDGTHQRQTYQEIQNLVNRLLSKTPFTNGNNPPPTIPVAIAVPLHQTGTEIEMTPTILPEVPTTPIYLAQQPTAPPLSKELVTA